MDKITLKHLRGACKEQRALFRATFPDGAPLTQESLDTAIAAGLHVSWLASRLPLRARAEYDRAVAPAKAEYSRAVEPVQAEYDRACGRVLIELLYSEQAQTLSAPGRPGAVGATRPRRKGN